VGRARALDLRSQVFGDFLAAVHDHLAGDRVQHVFKCDSADDTIAKRFDLLAALDDGGGPDSFNRPAVLLADYHVLCDVDQSPSQIPGVRSLQSRVGQTLASAVRRDEVLQHVQALAGIRVDRALDDFARRLGHQASHTGKLADLLFGAPRARVGHDQDRVQFALIFFDPIHFHEHSLGHLLGDVRPDRDHLVVAFAVGDDSFGVLLFDLGHIVPSRLYKLDLAWRSDQVVDPDRDTGLGCIQESDIFEAVEHLYRLVMPLSQVAVVDQ